MKFFQLIVGLLAVLFLGLSSSNSFAEEAKKLAESQKFKPKPISNPTQRNKILLVDNFNYPNMFNLLGGETQGDEEEPGGLIPSYTPTGRLTMGWLGHSLKMDYDVDIPMALAYYWSRFGPYDAQASTPGASFPINLEGFNYLSFWIKTDKEYPRFSLEFHQDINQDHLFTLGKDINSKISASSFILRSAEEISGSSAEVIVDVKDQKYLVQKKTAESSSVVEESKSNNTTIEKEKSAAEEKQEDSEGTVKSGTTYEFSMDSIGNIPLANMRSAALESEGGEQTKPTEETVSTPPKVIYPEGTKKKKVYKTRRKGRHSRKRVTFFQAKGPSGSPVKEVGRKAMARETAKKPIEVEVGSVLKTGPAVSKVTGTHSKGGDSVLAKEQVRAIRKGKVTWRKVVVSLDRFKTIKDWSSLLEIVFLFSERLGSARGIIYIDDLLFGTNYTGAKPAEIFKPTIEFLKVAPLKKGISAPAIRGIQMANQQEENKVLRNVAGEELANGDGVTDALSDAQLNSREKLKRFFNFEDAKDFVGGMKVPGTFLLYFKINKVDPTMEAIRIEISNDGGKSWHIATSLFHHQEDGEYVFPWRLPRARNGETPLQFRLSVSDIWGRGTAFTEPIKFEVGNFYE